MVMLRPPSVNGSGGATSANSVPPARFSPYSDAMLKLASAFPPDGFAALTNPPLLVWGAGPMLNVAGFEAPPPARAVKASTAARPTPAISAAGICTDRWLLSINVVGRFCPFQRTAVPAPKFEPVTVSVNSGPPKSADTGATELMGGCKVGPAGGARLSP